MGAEDLNETAEEQIVKPRKKRVVARKKTEENSESAKPVESTEVKEESKVEQPAEKIEETASVVQNSEQKSESNQISEVSSDNGFDHKKYKIEIHPVRKVEEAFRCLFG